MTIPARKLELIAQAEYRDEAEPLLTDLGQSVMISRGRPRSLVMRCPDGCGETLVVNLDDRAGKAWQLDMRGEGPTLFPSVWRDGGCDSHFIVWRGRIMWCDRFSIGNVEPAYDALIEPKILSVLRADELRSAVEIAGSIEELVWDVDRAARILARNGKALLHKVGDGWLFSGVP